MDGYLLSILSTLARDMFNSAASRRTERLGLLTTAALTVSMLSRVLMVLCLPGGFFFCA